MNINKTYTVIPLGYKERNQDRKWFELWKRRWIPKQHIIENIEINTEEESVRSDGTVIYKVSVDTSDVKKKVDKFVKELK